MHIHRCAFKRQILFQWRFLGRTLSLLASFLLFTMSALGFTPAYAASVGNTPPPAWHTFHDPVYGFSLSYPSNWSLATESDGSHITLLNPATKTTLSPIVTMQTEAAASVLKHASSTRGINQQTRIVAGHQAVDYLLPYMPQPQAGNPDAVAIGGPQQTRQVVIPVTNTSGTTNVYTFLLTQPTSTTGEISAAEQTDQSTFDALLNTFTLPIQGVSPPKAPALANVNGCDRACWADNNVYFTDYTATSTVSNGDWQPNYQCAEFVARALTQDGMTSGLNNGGTSGNYFPPSDQGSYGSYVSKGITYNLLNVGVPGIVGLHDYLLGSGLVTNIGANVSQAQVGDVVFFNEAGPGSSYHHTMIIVAIANGNIYMDGHNMSQYHALLGGGSFDIYHVNNNPIPNPTLHFVSSNGTGGSTLQAGYLPGNPTQLDVFGLGNDGNVWDLFKTGGAGSPWSSWGSHGNPGTQLTKLTVGTFSDGRLNLFATGADGNIWNNFKTSTASGASWSGWSSLGQAGNGFKGQVQVGTLPDGRINLFVLGNDGTVWNDFKNTTNTGSLWSGWSPLGTPGVQMTALTVGTFSDGRLNLFATGVDGNIWNMYKLTSAAGSAWSEWASLKQGDNGLRGQVQVGELPNGEMYLFSLADNGTVWGNFKISPATNALWSGWTPLLNPGGVALTKLTVGTFSDGRINLFATGSDGNVWNNFKTTTASGAPWSGWSPLGQAGNGSSSQVQTGTLSDGRLYLFVVGPDNSLWGDFKTTTDTGSKWSGWNTLTQPIKGLVQPNSGGYNNFASSNGHGSATVQTGYLPDAQLDLVALGTDANVWELSKKQDTLGSTWTAWNALATLGVQPSKVAVGTSLEGYLNLFVTDTQGTVWTNAKQSSDLNAPWGVWTSLGQAGTGVKGAVQIGTLPDGRLQLFALDTQGTPWTAVKTSTDLTAQWSAWGPLPTPSTPLSNLTVGTFSDGRLNLFATDATGTVVNAFKLTTAAGAGWSDWGSLGQAGTKLINAVQIGILPDGRLNLFTIGADGTIWNNVKLTADTGSSWSGWAPLPSLTSKDSSGALVTIRQLTVGMLADGRLDLLVTGSDGNVWNLYKQLTDPGSPWSTWGSLGQGTKGLTGQVQTGTLSDGRTYLFALGTDNSLWGNYKLTTDSGAAWSGWTSLGQPATSGGLVQ